VVDVSQVMIDHPIICKIHGSRLTTHVRNEVSSPLRFGILSSKSPQFSETTIFRVLGHDLRIKMSITAIAVIEIFIPEK
jgi:hypothetical protein